MPATDALIRRIQSGIDNGEIVADPVQADALQHLQSISDHLHLTQADFLKQNQSSLSVFAKRLGRLGTWRALKQCVAEKSGDQRGGLGMYIWGDVGRGKTWLMDQFYQSIEFEHKRRLHYHQFMQEVHDALTHLPSQPDPLEVIADRLIRSYRLICIDEFHVLDIADAMILYGLLKALFERGMTVVTTSNREPDELYKHGSLRERFLPAIELLKRHTVVFQLDHPRDYRLGRESQEGVFYCPHDVAVEQTLNERFEQLVAPAEPRAKSIRLYGRSIPVVKAAKQVIWFEFDVLCRGHRSSQDYIRIAENYQTVILSAIPQMHRGAEGPARRFLNLIDELYDQHVFLIISSEVPLTSIYKGDLLRFEFRRAMSRLEEMHSRSYWQGHHRLVEN